MGEADDETICLGRATESVRNENGKTTERMIEIAKSTAKGKKYTATLPSGKRVHFGAKGYFTQHGDAARREITSLGTVLGGRTGAIARPLGIGRGGSYGRSRVWQGARRH